MLNKWLARTLRDPSTYKFPVYDVTEQIHPDGELLNYLALALLVAHGNPYHIKDQYAFLLEDTHDNNLNILKDYLDKNILPSKKPIITRIGNFGEILVASFLVEFEKFWFPIYKLRFREKKDWAMRLSDLCLIQKPERDNPLICYGEVKTISSRRDKDIAIKGYSRLTSGETKDIFSNPEILHFVSHLLFTMHRYEESSFISRLQLKKLPYNKRHDLFIVHTKEQWVEEILERLDHHPLDNRLIQFSVKVCLISHLREIIDAVYERCTAVTSALIHSMDKQEYLDNVFTDLESLLKDRQFQNELAQVQARSIQEELSPNQPTPNYTFKPEEIWQKCEYIFSQSSLLLREGKEFQGNADKRKGILNSLRTAAESFEFLYKFASQFAEEDEEILLINSAICYHLAGYHANAQCLAKTIENKHHFGKYTPKDFGSYNDNLTWFFRRALIAFLRRDMTSLQDITEQTIGFVRTLQEKLISISEEEEVILNINTLCGHLFFQKSLLTFTHYCIHGTLEPFSLAQKNIDKAFTYFQNAGDTRLAIIASELRTLLHLFQERSTWSNIAEYGKDHIQNPIWRTYLRNLALEKSIVEFWRSQLKALEGGLLTADDSFIIQMPTSAGKTFIAELAILATLTNSASRRCLYIAPYRALVNEIEDRLAETLGDLGYRVSNLAGGFEFDSLQNILAVESHVLVATPEKADLLFRTHPEYFQDIATIIIDEGHMLDEGIPNVEEIDKDKTLAEVLAQNGTLGRGTSLEILITRLKQKLSQACFLFLSAVMPEVNVDDFVNWLSKESQKPLKIERGDRPSRQSIAQFHWLKVRINKKEEYNGQLQYSNPNGNFTFVPYFLQKEKYQTGELTATGRKQTISWPANTGNKTQTTAMLAAKFAKIGPVLVFCAMPSQVKKVVDNIIKSLKYLEASDKIPDDKLKYVQNPVLESFDLAKEWLGDEHTLTRGLHYGVGLHYGPLPDPVRQAIENDFKEGKISILVCTNTLGQGVNLPVKTAIIYSLERTYKDDEGKTKTNRVKKRDFWNICGRAGRAGKETEGQIVFVTTSSNDKSLFREYQDEQNIEVVESPLYKILEALIEKRISQDELIDFLDPYVLTLLAEEVVDTQDETTIDTFLKQSFVGIQALRNGLQLTPLEATIKHTSTRIYQEVPDPASRVVFASTGLRVKSCLALENAAEAFLQAHGRKILEDETFNLFLNKELLRFAFLACQDIPEMSLAKGINAREPQDELKLIEDWVEGKPINEIRSTYWATNQEDEFGDYIADRIIYKLPWGFNGFLRILAFKLEKPYDELPLSWQYLPSMMKFGVNSIFACWISSLGISSRRLALELVKYYPDRNDNSYTNFMRWAVNLSVDFLFQELSVGSVTEKKRFIGKMSRIVSDNTRLRSILQNHITLESSVQGIPYANRAEIAFTIREGDSLELEAEPTNPYDPSAVSILYHGKQVGYVERDKAKMLSKWLLSGRTFQTRAKIVKPPIINYAYPHILVAITG